MGVISQWILRAKFYYVRQEAAPRRGNLIDVETIGPPNRKMLMSAVSEIVTLTKISPAAAALACGRGDSVCQSMICTTLCARQPNNL